VEPGLLQHIGIELVPDLARGFFRTICRFVLRFVRGAAESRLAFFAGSVLRAAFAVVGRLADGVLGCEHRSTGEKSFGELD
jgi:hypothetical protein